MSNVLVRERPDPLAEARGKAKCHVTQWVGDAGVMEVAEFVDGLIQKTPASRPMRAGLTHAYRASRPVRAVLTVRVSRASRPVRPSRASRASRSTQ